MYSIDNQKELIKKWEKQKRRKALEDKIFLGLVCFLLGAIFGLVWAYMQAH